MSEPLITQNPCQTIFSHDRRPPANQAFKPLRGKSVCYNDGMTTKTISREITFTEAMKRLPGCCICAVDNCIDDNGETIGSIIAGVDHELTMYAEDQDGCITAKERSQCVRYLQWLNSKESL